MNTRFFSVSAVALTMTLALSSPAKAVQDPANFIGALGTQAIQVLGPQVPEAVRLARFREIFQQDFDIGGIGQFVLGRYWHGLDPQQKQEFLSMFQEYIARAYSARLGQYGGAPFQVMGSRNVGGEVIVNSQVARPDAQPLIIDWHLVDVGGQYKIEDVYVGGVSMRITQRDEFASVIQNNGNRPAVVLAILRQKLGISH